MDFATICVLAAIYFCVFTIAHVDLKLTKLQLKLDYFMNKENNKNDNN